MKRVLLLIMVLSCATVAQGGYVDKSEIVRMGDMVQHIDGNAHGQSDVDTFVEAMQPPEDDSDKWFISIVGSEGCGACQRLKRDWSQSSSLLALADRDNPRDSWAHFNWYYSEDQSQAWRFKNISITEYPTVIVQPPRNGRYGKGSTVVYQAAGYDGNPGKLAKDIVASVRMYTAKLENHPSVATDFGVNPPWRPAPNDEQAVPFQVKPFQRLIPQVVPDEVAVKFQIPWAQIASLFMTGFSVPAIIGLVIWVVVVIRNNRKAAGKQLLISDEVFKQLTETMQGLADNMQKPRSRSTTKKTVRK